MKALRALLLAGSILSLSWRIPAADAPRPNVLVILADDMGFSDAACYGGEIATPHLDKLARDGLRFTQFYNTARCWPSRAALLTGYYAQEVRRDTVPGVTSGSGGVRPAWARLLPERLRALGYRSYHSGKWHVDGSPLENGFDHSYSLDDHDRHFAPQRHTEDGKPLPPATPASGYYTTTAIADHAVRCLRDHAANYAAQPFFSYVAFTAPHFPLQAPAPDIARYRERYRLGWDALRVERWQRMGDLGLGAAAPAAIERDLGPPYPFPEAIARLGPNEINRPLRWVDLSDAQQTFQSDKMAIHAAMVDLMDSAIGRIVEQLRAMNGLEDTLILFLSDNGASAEMMVRGDGHDPTAQPGSAATFLSLGPGWSSLANTPFRRHKTWVHEGGISTPLIVHWPKGITGHGELRHTPAHLVDLAPTILALAGGNAPDAFADPPSPGHNLAPLFARDGAVTHASLWWQHEGNRALRAGDWKIVAAGADSAWELYDLATDRAEMHNLAEVQPDRVRELAARWTREAETFYALARKDAPPATRAKSGKKQEKKAGP